MTVLLPLLIALAAAPVALVAGVFGARWSARAAVAMAALAFGATLWGWGRGGGTVSAAWAPTWDLAFTFALDGLAALYALLATGIGVAVLAYASCYVPLHLEHQGRPEREAIRFYALIVLFMGAMVGLVMAQDLILLFVFWDLTAIASYFLIGYDARKAAARAAALLALLLTGVSAILLLIGALLLQARYGTFALPALAAALRPGGAHTLAVALIAIAGLVKSAQVPAHFWLPRAMAAPTPVSAYLHSAAMVAAGVFLLGRIYPLLLPSRALLDALFAIGLLSMLVGSVLALTRDALKQVLAYSTIAQYGYVVVMLSLGTGAGVVGATFYVIAHALAKSALFLTAGAVTEATGDDHLSRLGGQWRALPALAAASGAAAAGLAALPLTIGFFKDELFFAAALGRGWPYAALATLGAALTLAYVWQFWAGIFLGPRRGETRRAPLPLVLPVAVLGALVVVGGVAVAPAANLAAAAGAVSFAGLEPIAPAYHLDARPENLLALAAYALGALIVGSRRWWAGIALVLAGVGERLGPERWYRGGLATLNRFSRALFVLEARDLRSRVATILVPTALLLAIGLWATPTENAFRAGRVTLRDLPLVLALVLTAIGALVATYPRRPLTLVLALSTVGYSLAAVFAFLGAPDVALVAVLIETILTLLFLGVLALFPPALLKWQATRAARHESLRWRNALVGAGAGAGAFAVGWAALSQPAAKESVALEQARLTPAAHAGDVVTAILADFRGFDTMGEITVIAIALLGLAALLGRDRRATGDERRARDNKRRTMADKRRTE